MKKAFFIMLCLVMASCLLFACDDRKVNEENNPTRDLLTPTATEGLAYTLLDDGSYAVSVGTATTESNIYISDTYQGKNVTGVCENGFQNCTALREIVLPESLTSIGKNAFQGCTKLVTVNIPDSVTDVGEKAWDGCENITHIKASLEHLSLFPEENRKDIVLTGNFTFLNPNIFTDSTTLTSIILPDGVTTIGLTAFKNCSSLTSVVLPDSVSTIQSEAFFMCKNLSFIDIGKGVTGIGEKAFFGCANLTNIDLPQTVTQIDPFAFASCVRLNTVSLPFEVKYILHNQFESSGLTSVMIPDNVKSINIYAFHYCTNLQKVYYFGTEESWKKIRIDDDYHGNDPLFNATKYYYSDEKPTTSGHYWHYDDEWKTIIEW